MCAHQEVAIHTWGKADYAHYMMFLNCAVGYGKVQPVYFEWRKESLFYMGRFCSFELWDIYGNLTLCQALSLAVFLRSFSLLGMMECSFCLMADFNREMATFRLATLEVTM